MKEELIAQVTQILFNERQGIRKGDEVQHSCAFHDDAHPSAHFNRAKGVFNCFACGEKGTVFKLAAKLGIVMEGSNHDRR